MFGFASTTVYAPIDADGVLTSVCTCTTSIQGAAGATYNTSAVVDCLTEVAGEGLIGSPGSAVVNCDTDVTAISNRLSGSAIVECLTPINTFIGNNPAIKVYESGTYVGLTEGLDFVGATIVYGEETFTITTSGGTVAVDYDIEIDVVDADNTYYGYALPGTATNAAAWKIKKKIGVGDDSSFIWADGTSTLTKVWDNRASYTY